MLTTRIEVRPRAAVNDGRLVSAAHQSGYPTLAACFVTRLFFVSGNLSDADANRLAAQLLTDPVTETYTLGISPTPTGAHLVERTLLAGVTDPVADSLKHAAALIGIHIEQAATGERYALHGDLTPAQIEKIATGVLANTVIHRLSLGTPIDAPFVAAQPPDDTVENVPVRGLDDAALTALSTERRLSLDLNEMRAIQAYFDGVNREPTDAELEMLAQTWSEHCVHKTFRAKISYTGPAHGAPADSAPVEQEIDGLLRTYIRAATEEIDADWVRSAFVDNAGIVAFDAAYDVAFKVETHNRPSALEPFGGANTGAGGVIRDVLGVSARPIANTDVLCFGLPDTPADSLPDNVLHPRRIIDGVVHGIEDYGNKMGIPTVNGAVHYHAGYTANPLVFAGCVGIIPRGAHRTEAQAGDYIVVIGGRTGRDGLRGATFSSMEMDTTSAQLSGGAVQIGHPINEKQVLEVVLKARDAGLYTAITDCGAGGLSSAVGEMGKDLGATVQLQSVPLKYPGLQPWEIWLSEAQERMVLAVSPANWDAFLAICAAHDVEAVNIGTFESTGRLTLAYGDKPVSDISMDFLHNGIPRRELKAEWKPLTPQPPLPQGARGSAGKRNRPERAVAIPERFKEVMTEIARNLRRQSTKSEEILWQSLRNSRLNGVKFRRQHPIGAFLLDFYAPELMLAVEVDGSIHDSQVEADRQRQEIIEETGIKFLRFSAADVEQHLSAVLDAIAAAIPPRPLRERGQGGEGAHLRESLLSLLASPTIRSKADIVHRYDHEVGTGSAVKPLVGLGAGPGDAAVIVPLDTLDKHDDGEPLRAIALSVGLCPQYTDYDPYAMAWAAVDEAIRNAVAVGANPDEMSILDNFSWGNTQLPDRLGSLVRCSQGCYDAALAFGTPFVSGKDSLNNEYVDQDGVRRSIPGTLVISALGIVPDAQQTVTSDFKDGGNAILLIGSTRDEFGGSAYNDLHGLTDGGVPQPVRTAPETYRALHRAIRAGYVEAAHDLSEGGLAVALAEMCIGGQMGASVSLNSADGLDDITLAFSESQSRLLVEVAQENVSIVTEILRDAGAEVAVIGTTGGDALHIDAQTDDVTLTVAELTAAWGGAVTPLTPQPPLPRKRGEGADADSSSVGNELSVAKTDVKKSRVDRIHVPEHIQQAMRRISQNLRREETASEAVLWSLLRNRQLDGRKFRRQQPVGMFVLDFYCAEENLAVEVDGLIHETQQEADRERQEILENLGIRFVRLKVHEVEQDETSSLNKIRAAFLENAPIQSPLAPLARERGLGGEGRNRTTRKPVLILHATGSNRDRDAVLACELAGGAPEIVTVNQLVAGERNVRDYAMMVIPGGFSYGDDLGAGVLWALDLRERIPGIEAFISAGKPVMGICNGFQTLVKSGFLPGSEWDGGKRSITLTYNAQSRFECRWVTLQANPKSPCLFTDGLTSVIHAPIAHGEGRVMTADESTRQRMWADGLPALTYVGDGYPANPNGSVDAIAGLSNAAGNVFGLMPHPENHIFPWQHPQRLDAFDGLRLFTNGIRHA